MDRWLKMVGFGFLLWVIPFIISIPLVPLMTTDLATFKAVMTAVGGLSGMLLIVLYFKDVKEQQFREGAIVGTVWLLLNWALDIIILLPLTNQTLPVYFTQIGVAYLVAPAMTLGTGYLLENAKAKRE